MPSGLKDPHPFWARARPLLLAALGHLTLAVIATWPMVLRPGTLIGSPAIDVWNHVWGPWWFFERLSQGILPLRTDLLGAPTGGYLWYIDPVGALLGAPLVPVLGPVLAYNGSIVLLTVFAGIAGRKLATALGAGPRASWVGAVGVTLSPHALSELHNGISEAYGVAWVTFALAALVRAQSSGRYRDWVALGFWGGVTFWGTYYYALGLAFVAVVPVAYGLIRSPRAVLGVLIAAAVASAVAYPVVHWAQLTVADPSASLVFRSQAHWSERMWIFEHNAVDPRSFFIGGEFHSVNLRKLGEYFYHTSYIGYACLLLAIASRRWVYLLTAAVGLTFSLGPWLWYDEGWVLWQGGKLALPYRALLDVLPAGVLGHPQRTGLPALVLLIGLAASRVSEAPRWVLAAGAALGLEYLLTTAAWPVASAPFAAAEACAVIAREGAGQRRLVLDLPGDAPGQGMIVSRYLFGQTLHGQPLPYVPDVRANSNRLGGTRFFRALLGSGPDPGVGASRAELRQNNVGWVVVHTDIAPMPEAVALLTQWLGPPETLGPALLWRLPR